MLKYIPFLALSGMAGMVRAVAYRILTSDLGLHDANL